VDYLKVTSPQTSQGALRLVSVYISAQKKNWGLYFMYLPIQDAKVASQNSIKVRPVIF